MTSPFSPARVAVLSGGVGGARFLQGLLHHHASPGTAAAAPEVTVVANTADDIWLHGLKVCPDLDTVMYTLGGGIDAERGWGRTDETWHAKEELEAYGVEPTWFGLGDRDLATHLVRTQMLEAGYPLSAVTAALCERWRPGVTLLPMTDDRVETHVAVDDADGALGRSVSCTSRSTGSGCAPRSPRAPSSRSASRSRPPAPGVLEAIAAADVVLLPPSNPVVSVGTILGVPGIRDALRATSAPVVGLSPIVAGRHVRGMAAQLLAAIGVEVSAAAVAEHYGARGPRRRPRRLAGRHRRRGGGGRVARAGIALPRGAADDDRPRGDRGDGPRGLRRRRFSARRDERAGTTAVTCLPVDRRRRGRRRRRPGRPARAPRRRCARRRRARGDQQGGEQGRGPGR